MPNYKLTEDGEIRAENAARLAYSSNTKVGAPEIEDALRVVFIDFSRKSSGPYSSVKDSLL